MHQTGLALGKLSRDAVHDALVVEDGQVALLPGVDVDVLGRDGGAHESVGLVAGSLELEHGAVGAVHLVDTGGVDLQVMAASDRVGPDHGELLDLGLLPLGQLVQRGLLALGDHGDAVARGTGRRDEDVRVWGVLDSGSQSELLVLIGESVKGIGAREEAGAGLRDLNLLIGVFVLDLLGLCALRNVDAEQGCAEWW